MKRYFLYCYCFLTLFTSFGQNALIEQLKEDETIYLDIHFYPTTLRMINIQQDTAYNKLIKDIRKLSFYALDTEKMSTAIIRELISTLEEQQQYESYLAIDGGNKQQVQIIGNAAGDEWMGIAAVEGEYYLLYIEGRINWLQVPKVYEAISTQDPDTQTGFSLLLNHFGEDGRRRKKEREWARKRAEEKEVTQEENQIEKDTIN